MKSGYELTFTLSAGLKVLKLDILTFPEHAAPNNKYFKIIALFFYKLLNYMHQLVYFLVLPIVGQLSTVKVFSPKNFIFILFQFMTVRIIHSIVEKKWQCSYAFLLT